MLIKLVSIKNVGRFRNSAAGGDTQLRRRSFFVGPNGFGKTTVCAILRSLRSGDPALVIGRKTLGASAAPAIEILTASGMTRFDGSAWTTPHPDIAVFDGQFVADNIHSGEVVDVEHKRNLYRVIIGNDGVRRAEEDTALAAESRAKTGEVTAAARALNPHLPSGMKVEAYVALPLVDDIDAQIAEQEKKVASIQESAAIKARAGLTEFTAPAIDIGLEELLRRTIGDVAQDAEQRLATHVARHGMAAGGAEWIAAGVEFARGNDCPFCGQDIRGLPLVAAFRSVFSDSYKALKQDFAARRTALDRQFGDAALARLGGRCFVDRTHRPGSTLLSSSTSQWKRVTNFSTRLLRFRSINLIDTADYRVAKLRGHYDDQFNLVLFQMIHGDHLYDRRAALE